MSVPSKVWIWRNVSGLAGRCNDVIYMRPTLPPSQDVLVYFGGDVQDLQENMEPHADSKKYIKWSLQNTAHLLSKNFPKKNILVIRPSRIHITKNAMFSCFDNFVQGNEYGVPLFDVKHNAVRHLYELIKSSIKELKRHDPDEPNLCCDMENVKLTLMGFSKGCVVLNQFLHEFHNFQNKEPDVNMSNFIECIESTWWLDGGHGGSKDTWITDKSILKSLADLKICVYVHVTPYQVRDSHRPWICSEEKCFSDTLRKMGVLSERTLHFADKPRSLKLHFDILKAIKDLAK